jgi:hypothetical protein
MVKSRSLGLFGRRSAAGVSAPGEIVGETVGQSVSVARRWVVQTVEL